MAFKMYNFHFVKDLPQIISVEQSGLNLAGLFAYLEETYGSVINREAVKDGKLAPRTRIAINGVQAFDLQVEIPEGAEVLVSRMLPGG